jgi:hypothetical protein
MAVDLSDREWALLETASSAVPPPARPPAIGSDADYPDYITNLFLTVLDLQLHNVIVNNAILYYRKNGWDEVRTLADLETVLARFPDDTDGNRQRRRHRHCRAGPPYMSGCAAAARGGSRIGVLELLVWPVRSTPRRSSPGQLEVLAARAGEVRRFSHPTCSLPMGLGPRR